MNIFEISFQFNDSYAFRKYPRLTENQKVHQALAPDMSGESHPGVHRCEKCGELTDKWEDPLLGVIVKNRKYDIGITYDGVVIVSEKFKSVYTEMNLSGLKFRQLPDDHQFFAIYPVRALEFDAERRKTRFIKLCDLCGRYESVIGANPIFLKPGGEVGENEFVRSDLEFASGDEKNPLLLCGPVAANVLAEAKLKGLNVSPIQDDFRPQN